MSRLTGKLSLLLLAMGCATQDEAYYDLKFVGDPLSKADWELFRRCSMEATRAEVVLLPEWALALPPAIDAVQERIEKGAVGVADPEAYLIGIREQDNRIIVFFELRPAPLGTVLVRSDSEVGEIVTVSKWSNASPDWEVVVEKGTYDVIGITELSPLRRLDALEPQPTGSSRCDRVMVRTPVADVR